MRESELHGRMPGLAQLCSFKYKCQVMKLQLLRNATQVLVMNGKTILIDPMLAPKGSYDAFQQTGNDTRNPLVDLPIQELELTQLLEQVDAVLLTHVHLDHWDKVAQERLPKDIVLLCQPANAEQIRQSGFTQVRPIDTVVDWEGIRISRTGGRHGTGEVGQRMGIVSGYVLEEGDDRLYIAGDTIWCEEVQEAIDQYQPSHIVVNGGGARFVAGDPIVMDIYDIFTVCAYAPAARIHVVHLEAVNHGKERRADIKAALRARGYDGHCVVPRDGEWFIQ